MKNEFKTVYPLYGAKLEKRNKSGQFIIMRQDWIDKPILNPETLTGKLLWYTTENGYDYCHPYEIAKNRADIIVSALNKTDEQIALENLSLDMLEVLQMFLDCTTLSKNGQVTIDTQKHIEAFQLGEAVIKKAAGFTD